jgi:hypothetical protein
MIGSKATVQLADELLGIARNRSFARAKIQQALHWSVEGRTAIQFLRFSAKKEHS